MSTHVPLGSWARMAFDGSATSAAALAWCAPVSVIVAVATMPYDVTGARSWLIATAAQAVFSVLVLLAGRASSTSRHRRTATILIILVTGALRGVLLVEWAAWASGTTPAAQELLARAGNSALICVLVLGVLGIVISGTADFRREYEILLQRAIRLRQDSTAARSSLDPEALATWVGLQRSLQRVATTSRQRLEQDEVTGSDLQAAADLIGDMLDRHVRPVSHRLWRAAASEPPRLRVLHLAWDALRPWRPPVILISAVYAVISIVGSSNRAGAADGLVFALYSTLTVTIVLSLSFLVGILRPGSRLVGLATLALLPAGVVGVAQVIGQGLLQAPPDMTGALVAGFSASILTEAIVLARRVSTERELLLGELQRRIDAQAITLLGSSAGSGPWDERLGTFVHHSVQSELTAMRLRLQSAAHDESGPSQAAAGTEALERFDRLLQLAPPWEAPADGRSVVSRVAEAWDGIADVRCMLSSGGAGAQWRIVGEIVEEGVANAVRRGGARRVGVTVTSTDDEALLVVIEDDGRGVDPSATSGLGTWWLDRVAPGDWTREPTGSGTRLSVRVT